MISVQICFYDRIDNFLKWLKISEKLNEVEFIFYHNCNDLKISESWKKIANRYNVKYIQRENIGYDVGIFQEVCKQENNFDFLLWFTDDCIPTSTEFIDLMVNPFSDSSIGISCFEISKEIRPHIRTTGFAIRKEILNKIIFPSPKIKTKQECYVFEHGQNNLYLQILKMGFKAHEIEENIFWNPDSRKVKKIGIENLENDLNTFLGSPDVQVFSTAYNRYPQIISSLLCQTFKNISLCVCHDGKMDENIKRVYEMYGLKNIETEKRYNDFGHSLRKEFLKTDIKAKYLLITNEDNYLSPYFLEKAVEILEKHPDKIGAYCSMVHNYKPDGIGLTWKDKKQLKEIGHVIDGYGVIQGKPEQGFIDISSVLFRTQAAQAVEWNDFSHSGDWTYIKNIMESFGKDKLIKFDGIHLVHN